MTKDEHCFFCDDADAKSSGVRIPNRDSRIQCWNCPKCGDYWINRTEASMHKGGVSKQDRAKFSILCRERKIHNQSPVLVTFQDHGDSVDWLKGEVAVVVLNDFLRNSWPQNPLERLNRALGNLESMSPELGTPISLKETYSDQIFFGTTSLEADFIREALKDRGDIQISPDEISKTKITPQGWTRLAELGSRHGDTNAPVFVAMWFGGDNPADKEKMNEVYGHIARAVQEAGYRVKRADSEPHNDYITNKIIADIHAAPFLIAEFTGNNLGVYYEAGLGRGLNKQVVQVCEKGTELHFDTQQISTVFWEQEEDIYDKLKHHILATIDKGPFPTAD